MAALPDDVWRRVVEFLPSMDAGNFKSSHRHAVEILGKRGAQKLKSWKRIFASHEWVKTASFHGLFPVLLFTDEDRDKPYVYLYLTTKLDDKQDREGYWPEYGVIFNEVKASLRPNTPGRYQNQVEFEELTLSINVIRYKDPIECQDLFRKFNKKSLTLVVYGKRPRTVPPLVYGQEFAIIAFAPFQSVAFRDKGA